MGQPVDGVRRDRTRLRRTARATGDVVLVVVVLAVLSSVITPAPSRAAAFPGTEAVVYLAQGSPTQLMVSSQVAGALTFSDVGVPRTPSYNAIGYNEVDDHIYGASGANIIQIHADGTAVVHKPLALGSAHLGAFEGETSRYWYSNAARVFWDDVATTDPAVEVPLTGGPFGAADITWAGGAFWGLGGGNIHRLETSGVITSWPAPPALASYTAGGAWTYGNGNLGFTDNASGDISQVAVTDPASATPSFTVISVIDGPPTGNNDAAAALGAPADLAVAKAFDPIQAKPGHAIEFDITVTNLGPGVSSGHTITDAVPVGLTNVVLPDTCTSTGGEITCSGGRLDIGEHATFSFSADVATSAERGTITNRAVVLGNEDDPVAGNNEAAAELRVGIPALEVVKAGVLQDVDENGRADVGETITYTFDVTNTGDFDLADVSVTDPLVDGILPVSTHVAVGETVTFSAVQLLTQADIDAGEVVNTATASGVDPYGDPLASDPSTVVVEVPTAPALAAVKHAELDDTNANGVADEGETITFSVDVTNTGNVTLTDVAVDDPQTDPMTPTSAVVAPGETVTFVAPGHAVTAEDVASGSVDNTAVATATAPDGSPIESEPTTTTTPTVRPEMGLAKNADLVDANGNGVADPGEMINYTFVVSNSGNTRLEDVTVRDPNVRGITPATATVAPGEAVVFTAAPYTVTEADLLAGAVDNTATAEGRVPAGLPVTTPPASTTVPTVDLTPAVTIAKTASLHDVNGNDVADLSEAITYSFVVVNTGNVTLRDVAISDPMVRGVVPALVDVLAPGELVTLTALPYVVTEADVRRGHVENQAVVVATAPDGRTLSAESALVRTPAALLAATGIDAAPLATSGSAALLMGGLLLLLTRERRRPA